MVDNFFFEIEHYGAMLNANRTYYLTRSQPPFMSSMVVDVYEALQKSGAHKTPPLIGHGLSEPTQTSIKTTGCGPAIRIWPGETGLSRYYDFGDGPPAEAVQDESGFYRKVAQYFFLHPGEANDYIVEQSATATQPVAGAAYSMQVCDVSMTMARAECEKARQFKLSADYYKGDRSMRESGFDVSFRFGAFGSATHHYAPVCLNSLLYKTEKDLEQISIWLGHSDKAKMWNKRADERKKLIDQYLWNGQQGLFYDFNFLTKQMSTYKYASDVLSSVGGLRYAGAGQGGRRKSERVSSGRAAFP